MDDDGALLGLSNGDFYDGKERLQKKIGYLRRTLDDALEDRGSFFAYYDTNVQLDKLIENFLDLEEEDEKEDEELTVRWENRPFVGNHMVNFFRKM